MINIKDFDSNLLKLDKKSSENIPVYYIGYITKKDEYKINSVNSLYLLVHEIDGFIEEKEGSKYLNIALTYSNSEVLKKYEEIWKLGEYGKDYMKIKFNSDADLSLNKQMKFFSLRIIGRTIFGKDGKYYPQFFLDECLYEV